MARARSGRASGPETYTRAGTNRVLDNLPRRIRRELDRKLEPIDLPFRQELFAPNEPITHVYFPLSGVVSLVSKMADGSIVEVATTGNEGMVGLPVYLGADRMPGSAFSQVPGHGLQLSSPEFRKAVRQSEAFAEMLNRYSQALFNQVAQSAACNRVHPADERTARWLLMTHDRVATDTFPLTQEFLAQMLGVRRAAVNVSAGSLQRAGLIQYSRGSITVLDRRGLEAASCECYKIIRDEYDRLLPPTRNDE